MKHELAPGTRVRPIESKEGVHGFSDRQRARRDRYWGREGVISSVRAPQATDGFYIVRFDDRVDGIASYHISEFEVLPDKYQPFYVDLSNDAALEEGDQLLVLYPGDVERWSKTDAHFHKETVNGLQHVGYYGLPIKAARRLIQPK